MTKLPRWAAWLIILAAWALLLPVGVVCALALPLNIVLVPCWAACATSLGVLPGFRLDPHPASPRREAPSPALPPTPATPTLETTMA